jgi:hypothetical protein
MEILPQELVEKILLPTDLATAITTGNKYYINKMYNKNSWAWAAENNQLNTIIWLHFNKRNDFDDRVLGIVNEYKYEKIHKFLKQYDYGMTKLKAAVLNYEYYRIINGMARLSYSS